MTDSPSDDARLRAAEAQMRRALGLHNASSAQAVPIPPPASPGASSPQRRRFVRDGEVPVSVIRRDQDDGANTNRLDATRQALREQIETRERAEHLLQEAQATIRDLQTKLAHERLARDEAIRRADSEKQLVEQALQRVQDELAIERDCRRKAEQERDDALAGRQEAEERLRAVGRPPHNAQGRPGGAEAHARSADDQEAKEDHADDRARSSGGDEVKQPRRRGRPVKSGQSEAEIVEWWKPDWRNRTR